MKTLENEILVKTKLNKKRKTHATSCRLCTKLIHVSASLESTWRSKKITIV